MRSSPSAADPLEPGAAGFAHRGLHDGAAAPENSVASCRAAIAAGAGVECDLRLTSDDEIVVFHDADALRMCGESLPICRSSLRDLAGLRIGGDPIPTLRQLLELVGGRVPLLLEVKTDEDVARWPQPLGRALGSYAGAVGVMSFDPLLVRAVHLRLPQRRRGLVIGADLSSFRRKLALSLAAPEFVAVDRVAVGDQWVADLRALMPVYSWTIRTPEQRAQAQVQADALIWEADGRP